MEIIKSYEKDYKCAFIFEIKKPPVTAVLVGGAIKPLMI